MDGEIEIVAAAMLLHPGLAGTGSPPACPSPRACHLRHPWVRAAPPSAPSITSTWHQRRVQDRGTVRSGTNTRTPEPCPPRRERSLTRTEGHEPRISPRLGGHGEHSTNLTSAGGVTCTSTASSLSRDGGGQRQLLAGTASQRAYVGTALPRVAGALEGGEGEVPSPAQGGAALPRHTTTQEGPPFRTSLIRTAPRVPDTLLPPYLHPGARSYYYKCRPRLSGHGFTSSLRPSPADPSPQWSPTERETTAAEWPPSIWGARWPPPGPSPPPVSPLAARAPDRPARLLRREEGRQSTPSPLASPPFFGHDPREP